MNAIRRIELRASGAATPATLNEASRTVECQVVRLGVPLDMGVRLAPDGRDVPWRLQLDPAGMNAERLPGAPLLVRHGSTDVADQVGVVVAHRIEAGALIATVQFGERAQAEELFTEVKSGAVRNVSIGFSVSEYDIIEAPDDGGAIIYLATAWTPMEITVVAIGQDPAAQFLAFQPPARGAAADITPADGAFIAQLAAQAAERGITMQEILAAMPPTTTNTLSAPSTDVAAAPAAPTRQQFRDGLVNAVARQFPDLSGLHTLVEPRPVSGRPVSKRAAIAEALACQVLGTQPSRQAMDFMGLSLFDAAAICLEDGGRRLSRLEASSRARVFELAHTTGDFPGLFVDTGNRILTGLREAAPSPVSMVSRPRTVDDFRPFSTISAAGPAVLEQVLEQGGVTYSTLQESKGTGTLATYGLNIKVSRQMVTNDDLQVLASSARLFASSIAETERRLLLAMVAANGGGWGPTMQDGTPLFHTDHKNVTSGTATTTGISAARKTMREQTDLNGNLLAIGPAVLLSGATSETGLEQAISTITIATAEASRPIFSGLSLAVEAGITGAEFFAFAPPAIAPVLEYVTLAGRPRPVFETFTGADVDGVTLRCLYDVALVATSWIGAVRVTGS